VAVQADGLVPQRSAMSWARWWQQRQIAWSPEVYLGWGEVVEIEADDLVYQWFTLDGVR
jgi:hypothetical protein